MYVVLWSGWPLGLKTWTGHEAESCWENVQWFSSSFVIVGLITVSYSMTNFCFHLNLFSFKFVFHFFHKFVSLLHSRSIFLTLNLRSQRFCVLLENLFWRSGRPVWCMVMAVVVICLSVVSSTEKNQSLYASFLKNHSVTFAWL